MKTAFITGANGGLGTGFVEYLLGQGFSVFGGVQKLTDELPQKSNLVWVPIDVTSDSSIAEARKFVSSRVSGLDILINNAGVNSETISPDNPGRVSKLGELDRGVLDSMFQVNTFGPMFVIKEFLPMLKSSPSFIVNISSCRASFHDRESDSSPNYGYRASKVALNMLVSRLVLELPVNVKIVAVHPGWVQTPMNPEAKQKPFDQARQIIGITEKWRDESNGRFLNYDGEFYPL